MGSGHSHRASDGVDDQISVGTTARTALLAALGVALLLTLVGLVVWLPPGDAAEQAAKNGGAAAQFAAPGVTFPTAEVVEVAPKCAGGGLPDGSGCSTLSVRVPGEKEPVVLAVPPDVIDSGIGPGDKVELLRTPAAKDAEIQTPSYSYFATERHGTLLWLAVGFVVVVLAIARLRGLFALVGLAFGGAVVWWWMLPALLDGASSVGVALTSAAAIMFVVLYTTHGFSLRTSTALAGTLVGIFLTAGIGVIAIGDARLTGVSDEGGQILATFGALDFQALLGCALVIAGLGVLNDVTITQASAVWEPACRDPARLAGHRLRQRDADRTRPHRLDDLHDRLRLRRHRADPAHAAARLRPTAAGVALDRADSPRRSCAPWSPRSGWYWPSRSRPGWPCWSPRPRPARIRARGRSRPG
ncbi:YibE/F family protein [Nocardioides convexus]|uniref:YibE/F family protein n=1 Tax=Nocardioides convexus TaxID=2712224 RepID=UPI0024187049|nr:YibE/F family protein [Nocardioides convexus]